MRTISTLVPLQPSVGANTVAGYRLTLLDDQAPSRSAFWVQVFRLTADVRRDRRPAGSLIFLADMPQPQGEFLLWTPTAGFTGGEGHLVVVSVYSVTPWAVLIGEAGEPDDVAEVEIPLIEGTGLPLGALQPASQGYNFAQGILGVGLGAGLGFAGGFLAGKSKR